MRDGKENVDKNIESIKKVEDISVKNGTTKENIGLPKQVELTLKDKSTVNANVTWKCEEYSEKVPKEYTFKGEIELPEHVTNTNDITITAKVIVNAEGVLKEVAKGTGVSGKLDKVQDGAPNENAKPATAVVEEAKGKTLTVKDLSGKNNGIQVTISKNNSDELAVESKDGKKLDIKLASTDASKNTAVKIADKVKGLGTKGEVDFSKFEVTSEGNWDDAAVGTTLTKASDTTKGGKELLKGKNEKYTLTISTDASEKGQIKTTVGTKSWTVEVTKGQEKNAIAAAIKAEIDKNALEGYTAEIRENVITLTKTEVGNENDLNGSIEDVK